ncbi:MAG: hypothetical protein QW279_07505 [Candidatus Jordarchaeaceae archaeon]
MRNMRRSSNYGEKEVPMKTGFKYDTKHEGHSFRLKREEKRRKILEPVHTTFTEGL